MLSNSFVEGGFGAALIQKKNPTQTDYSTVFYWNVFLSVVLYGILFIGSPFIADFFNNNSLCTILRVQALRKRLQPLPEMHRNLMMLPCWLFVSMRSRRKAGNEGIESNRFLGESG